MLDGTKGDRLGRYCSVGDWFVLPGCPLGCLVCSFVFRNAAVTFDHQGNYLFITFFCCEKSANFVDSCTLLISWQY